MVVFYQNCAPSHLVKTGSFGSNSFDKPCAPDEHILPRQIKRLSSSQFRNSVENAFGKIFSDSHFVDFDDSNPRLGLANDPELMEINEVNISSFYDSADNVAGRVLASVQDVVSCNAATSDGCYSSLIDKYGQKLWRRPLTSQEKINLLAVVNDFNNTAPTRQEKLKVLFLSLVLSVNHLYRTELGTSQSLGQNTVSLSDYEIASLISFSIWNSPPDDALLSLAAQSQLHNSAILEQQINRMMQDNRFQKNMAAFLIDFLKVADIKSVNKDSSYNLTDAERAALYQSATNGFEQAYSTPNTDLFAAFRGQDFYVNQTTARFFNSTSSSPTLSLQRLPADQRYGALSHPAFLTSISGVSSSGIVRRGVFTIEQLLCNHIPAAPGNVMGVTNLPSQFNPDLVSSREVLQVTHSGQSTCMMCHKTIDPAGFGYENFNALGQFRTTEKNNIQIDASGKLSSISSQEIIFSNSVSYFQALEKNVDFRSCVQKKLFQYTIGQNTTTRAGHCEYENLDRKIRLKDTTLATYFNNLISLDSIMKRKPE